MNKKIILDACDISNILWALSSFTEYHSQFTYQFNGIDILYNKIEKLMPLDISATYEITVKEKDNNGLHT